VLRSSPEPSQWIKCSSYIDVHAYSVVKHMLLSTQAVHLLSIQGNHQPSADSLALVPLTPDDTHAPSLRRSSCEHKKPRPYHAASQAEPPDKPSTSKGLQRGFLKWLLSALHPFQWLANVCLATWGFAFGICHWYTWLALTCLACMFWTCWAWPLLS